MVSDTPFVSYAILHPRFYESLNRYRPSAEYSEVVRQYLDDSWVITVNGFWTNCTPRHSARLQHAWKIHVSTTPSNAKTTLRRVVPVLADERVAFKFCSDERMLVLSLSKNWSQAQAGKTVAIYPENVEQFKRLLERLHAVTSDLAGPYVLSDRPYRDSRVLFYRYGEHYGVAKATERGRITRGFYVGSDEWYADERLPYFRLPAGIKDPLSDQPLPVMPGEDGVYLQQGRYQVRRAFKFNAVGGIYLATDRITGHEVVIREARKFFGPERDGRDSVALLEKEARILKKLAPTGLLPQFVDLFQEWDHTFLVQEKVEGESLWGYAINFYFTPGYTPSDTLRDLRATIRKIIQGLQLVHRAGVVLRDLTRNNILVTRDDQVRFIDLEFAYDMEAEETPVPGFTAGYASPEQLRNETPSPADDCYSLGALILDIICFTAAGLPLNRDGILAGLRHTLRDLRLPSGLFDVVTGLIEVDPVKRWGLEEALRAIEALPEPRDTAVTFPAEPRREPPSRVLRSELRSTLDGVLTFLDESADFSRLDRLWPASPELFVTNPVSLQYGAAGPAFLLLMARGEVPQKVADWIANAVRTYPCPAGLFSGYAGAALLFLMMGRTSDACEILALADRNPESRFRLPGLFYGAAGWGLTQLHFWDVTGDRDFLNRACEAGEHLIATSHDAEEGCYWETDGQTLLGYGEGQSGIALFLVFLFGAVGDSRYLKAATRAIDFDLSKRQEQGTKLLWYPRADAAAWHPKSPHMWFGTAGVGTAVLRCYTATNDPRYLHFARWCANSIAHRYTNKIWHNYGLAGFAEYMLDMYQTLGEERYLNDAYYLAEGMLPYRVREGNGLAFPGTNMFRICSDFGEGTAGIGVLLHRLLNPSTPRLLMLDHLLKNRTSELHTGVSNGQATDTEVVGA
jgi:Lanthionine synthetase C-like protein./Protein kinase domain.